MCYLAQGVTNLLSVSAVGSLNVYLLEGREGERGGIVRGTDVASKHFPVDRAIKTTNVLLTMSL